jgi:putative flippase GtrA
VSDQLTMPTVTDARLDTLLVDQPPQAGSDVSAFRRAEYPRQGEAHMRAFSGPMTRVRAAVDVLHRELIKFGAIGALAYVVDVYVYNVLRTGWWPLDEAPLSHKPLLAKVVSVAVATLVAWLGNRYWTFRRRRQAAVSRELFLFVVMNVGGLLIAAACMGFSHYVLGLRSALADNISGNVIGLGLGTLFRFWSYRTLIFTETTSPTENESPAAAENGAQPDGDLAEESELFDESLDSPFPVTRIDHLSARN